MAASGELRHGAMRGGYLRGCRCSECRGVNAERVRRNRERRQADPSRLNCGTRSAYDAGCRCEACLLLRQSVYWREEGIRPHVWRDYVTEVFHLAWIAWEQRKESHEFMNWSLAEYRDAVPSPPTFKATLIGLSRVA